MKRKDSFIWILPSIFIIFFLFSVRFCTRKINEEYIIDRVKRENIDLFISVKGEVEARDLVQIGLDVELGVDEIYFNEGDYVKQGDLIIRFSEYQDEYLEKELNVIKENLAVKRSNLRFEEEKYQMTGDNNIEKLQQLRREIQSLENELIGKSNKKNLIVRNISSPVNGNIIKLNAVKGKTNDPTKPILIIAKKTDIKIVTEVIEKEKADLLQIGNVASIKSLNNPENEFEAVLYKKNNTNLNSLVALELLTKSVENRYISEILDIRVYYQRREQVLTVPLSSLLQIEDKDKKIRYYIFTINKENKVSKKEVEMGISNGEVVEIKKGINEGEEIIVFPNKRLENNKYKEEIEKNDRKILKLERDEESKFQNNEDKKSKEPNKILPDNNSKPMTLEEMDKIED